jgi:hypothetical protein
MDIRTDARKTESSRTVGNDAQQNDRARLPADGRVFTLRTAFSLTLLFVASCAKPAHADDTIRVLLSDAPGAPTPTQVMNWVNTIPRVGPEPLAAFQVKAPLVDYWLIPDRASGDFLAWLNANPYSVRKKLEDYQLMVFAPADIPVALAALQADPYVLEASVASQYELSSAEKTEFDVSMDGPLTGEDQYGWFDLNIDAAWQLASGYALIGQIDMGL